MEDVALTLDAMLNDLLSNNDLDYFLQDRPLFLAEDKQ